MKAGISAAPLPVTLVGGARMAMRRLMDGGGKAFVFASRLMRYQYRREGSIKRIPHTSRQPTVQSAPDTPLQTKAALDLAMKLRNGQQ